MMMTRLPAEYPAGGDASVCAQSHLARGGARLVREEDDYDDNDDENGDGKYNVDVNMISSCHQNDADYVDLNNFCQLVSLSRSSSPPPFTDLLACFLDVVVMEMMMLTKELD